MVGVSGVGVSLQEAFQGCIGEGIEYLSQLQTRSDVLERPRVRTIRAAALGPHGAATSSPRSRRYRLRSGGRTFLASRDAIKRWMRRFAAGGYLRAAAAVATRLPAAVSDEHRFGGWTVVGRRGPAWFAGVDRARCGRSVVARRPVSADRSRPT